MSTNVEQLVQDLANQALEKFTPEIKECLGCDLFCRIEKTPAGSKDYMIIRFIIQILLAVCAVVNSSEEHRYNTTVDPYTIDGNEASLDLFYYGNRKMHFRIRQNSSRVWVVIIEMLNDSQETKSFIAFQFGDYDEIHEYIESVLSS